MEIFTKAQWKQINIMEKENINPRVKANMMESGVKEREMGMVYTKIFIITSITALLLII